MRYLKTLLTLAAIAMASVSYAKNTTQWEDNKTIAKLFAQKKLKGTFAMYDVSEDKWIGYNSKRANTRYIPASTYKIPNSLIGLSVGAVKGVDDVFPYDGKPFWREVCMKDMDMREAFKLSCVPYYQDLARKIGLEQMQAAVKKLDYGNEDIGSKVDQFWLDGPLKISAIEQTKFLAKLAQKSLPFPIEAQEQIHDIAKIDQGDDWVLYGKTGWTGKSKKPSVGWWVGWVQKGDKVYAFALNIDMPKMEDANKRIELGRDSLKELGVL
jgi:beta-lactamase class D